MEKAGLVETEVPETEVLQAKVARTEVTKYVKVEVLKVHVMVMNEVTKGDVMRMMKSNVKAKVLKVDGLADAIEHSTQAQAAPT